MKSTMETKLHLEIDGNVLDVAGEPAFVETVYEDFKRRIGDRVPPGAANDDVVKDDEIAPLVAMTASGRF